MKILLTTLLMGLLAGNPASATDDKPLDASLNKILTDARCVPEFEGGKPIGYRCFQIVPGSIYDKIGLKDNDVIYGMNGEKLDDPMKFFNAIHQLNGAEKDVSLGVRRGGKDMNLVFKPMHPISAKKNSVEAQPAKAKKTEAKAQKVAK